MLLQFSWSQSVWWRYIQSACWCYCRAGPLCSKDFIITIFQRLNYKNLHKTYVKHLNCKLYYWQQHMKYWCNLARYWLQAPQGWHDSVKTCRRSVIICEIIAHLFVTVKIQKKWQILINVRSVIEHEINMYINNNTKYYTRQYI